MSAVPPPNDDSDEEETAVESEEPSGDHEAKIDLMLEEYLTGGDVDDALQCLKEFKATTYNEFVNRVRDTMVSYALVHTTNSAILQAIVFSLEKKEKDCDAVMRLLSEFHKQSALNKSHFEKGYALCPTATLVSPY